MAQTNNLWSKAPVKELTYHPQYGWTTSASKSENGLKLLRTTDISGGSINWDTVPVCLEDPFDIGKYLVKEGDILVSRAGSVGLSYYIENPQKAIFASYLIRFRAKEDVIKSKFLYYFFQSPQYWQSIGAGKAGIAIPNVNATKISEIEVSYPLSLEEQERIIEHLDDLLPKVKLNVNRLIKTRKLINKFRQAILSAAVTGRLTEDWRSNNQYKTVTLERFTTVIPEDWELIPFGEKVAVLTDYHANGSYETLKKHIELKDAKDYAIMIRTTNLENKDFETNLKYITKDAYEFLAKSKVLPEDLLMNKIANPGVAYFMPTLDMPVSLAMNLFLIRTTSDVKQQYAYYFLKANEGMVKSFSRGSTTKTIDKKSVRSIPFVLPSKEEQEEIVLRVNKYMKMTDDVEEQTGKVEARVSKLTQAILAKTFTQD